MLKYLNSSGSLVSSRNADTDKAVVFEYDLSSLIKVIYETCQNMVKIASDQNGNILVDEYSMDEDTPTMAMKNQIFNNACSQIMDKMHWLVSDTIISDSAGGYNVEYGESAKTARFPIDNVDTYQISTLSSMDLFLHDMVVYGTLDAWFMSVASEPLMNMARVRYNEAVSGLSSLMRPMYRKYRFSKVEKYV